MLHNAHAGTMAQRAGKFNASKMSREGREGGEGKFHLRFSSRPSRDIQALKKFSLP